MHEEKPNPAPSMPPDMLAYMAGATEESLQFDFLIGNWRVEGRRFGPGGEVLLTYGGRWRAHYLLDRRMVMDEFVIQSPGGQDVSAFVTLRTYSTFTRRWEMAGMPAFQPAVSGPWFGHRVDGEMHLEVEGRGPDGRTVMNRIRFHDIAADDFSWESRISLDGGATWTKAAALQARRVKEA